MPVTYILVLVAGLSLVGIIPLAGFWSKDEILLGAWNGTGLVDNWVNKVTFSALIGGVIVTAFYTIRMIILTFPTAVTAACICTSRPSSWCCQCWCWV